ncbi:hypothetical protein TIFTF001_014462 [Ficus carica]|uniref:Uncharacterized protein n=1 Tax=Ficus carica TaxID=3494 RepID=A0AA88A2S3_FICCA|nr:hypothetical protein TIFTF001_014462 [Ficus carica]
MVFLQPLAPPGLLLRPAVPFLLLLLHDRRLHRHGKLRRRPQRRRPIGTLRSQPRTGGEHRRERDSAPAVLVGGGVGKGVQEEVSAADSVAGADGESPRPDAVGSEAALHRRRAVDPDGGEGRPP